MEHCKNFLKTLRPALTVTLVLMLICGLGYPLLMTGLSQILFPSQANGGLISADGQVVGSRYVGQEFTQPWFMKGRPSAVHYNTCQVTDSGKTLYLDGTPFSGPASGSSNYGPSNPALRQRVQDNIVAFLAANPAVSREDIPTDLMTASGSGLDPHISPASAAIQLPAIAQASGLPMDTLEQIVADHTTGKLFGIFGEEVVNVLEVNIDIAQAMKLPK